MSAFQNAARGQRLLCVHAGAIAETAPYPPEGDEDAPAGSLMPAFWAVEILPSSLVTPTGTIAFEHVGHFVLPGSGAMAMVPHRSA